MLVQLLSSLLSLTSLQFYSLSCVIPFAAVVVVVVDVVVAVVVVVAVATAAAVPQVIVKMHCI